MRTCESVAIVELLIALQDSQQQQLATHLQLSALQHPWLLQFTEQHEAAIVLHQPALTEGCQPIWMEQRRLLFARFISAWQDKILLLIKQLEDEINVNHDRLRKIQQQARRDTAKNCAIIGGVSPCDRMCSAAC
jgi:hypothetical protein